MDNLNSIELGLDTLVIKGDPTKLYESLAAAALEFVPIPRSDEGAITEKRTFRYAGYATIIRCVRPALSKHGIALIQPLHFRDHMAVTTTILAGHGASVATSFYFETDKNPQEFGRRHTYYRRYQLQAMLGVEGDDDADNLPRPEVQFADKPPKSEPKSTPKTEPKAEPKVEPKAEPKQTEPASEPSPPPGMTEHDVVNKAIIVAAKKLAWDLPKIQEFYKTHIDKAGFDKSDDLSVTQKRVLLRKIKEVHGLSSP